MKRYIQKIVLFCFFLTILQGSVQVSANFPDTQLQTETSWYDYCKDIDKQCRSFFSTISQTTNAEENINLTYESSVQKQTVYYMTYTPKRGRFTGPKIEIFSRPIASNKLQTSILINSIPIVTDSTEDEESLLQRIQYYFVNPVDGSLRLSCVALDRRFHQFKNSHYHKLWIGFLGGFLTANAWNTLKKQS